MRSEQFEIVFGGQLKDGLWVGGDVKGETFDDRGEAEAEAARMRRSPDQVIRVRRVGDTAERLNARRVASRNLEPVFWDPNVIDRATVRKPPPPNEPPPNEPPQAPAPKPEPRK